MTNITQVVGLLISLIFAIIAIFVIPYMKRKVGTEKLAEAWYWVEIAVRAAEQIYIGSNLGANKKECVTKFLQSKGLVIDYDSLDNMIEAAVYELHQSVTKELATKEE